MEFKNSPIFWSNAPPPETKAFNLPPNCFLTFLLTNISHKNEDLGYYEIFQVQIFVRENAKKVTRLYLHASVSGYTCMQAYLGGNTKRGKWVYFDS